MTASRGAGRVYISHSHRDNELVRDLARRLRDAGLKPVVDFAEVRAGTDWKKALREQIRDSEAVLKLVTPAALSSAWAMAELGMAEGFDRTVLPVTAGLKRSELPAPLRSYQVTPFDQVDDAINLLSERLTAAAKK